MFTTSNKNKQTLLFHEEHIDLQYNIYIALLCGARCYNVHVKQTVSTNIFKCYITKPKLSHVGAQNITMRPKTGIRKSRKSTTVSKNSEEDTEG